MVDVAGILGGRNPLDYSPSSPYTLFLFQAVFIILLCQLLMYPTKKLQQPSVIAEVVAGILLGPSVMGRIPNFLHQCFPSESIPGLTLLANLGIILFLFIIGLEVDITFIKRHFKVATSVGIINMAIPFGLGCAIAYPLYNNYDPNTTFTTFMVFIAVAMCITAFPVLARILTELNLIGDRVGTIVLAAGIINDLTGWILLALVVTLANADNGVTVVYILLLTFGWFLFLVYPVRIVMRFLLGLTGELKTGYPTQISMIFILVLVFISSFFTDIIGVHPIFGAFMIGIIIPRDNGYVVKITEKLEDLVHIVLIPIYFALAGLNVDLGLLNKGADWGYTIGIIALAMVGKVVGGIIGAKIHGLLFRESLAVGILMSCKGIVEIVVLNVGLSAGIINQRIYSMFIVMALATTFATTPLAIWLYPSSYRIWRDEYLKGKDNSPKMLSNTTLSIETIPDYQVGKIILLLRNIDSISYLMTFIKSFTDVDVKAIHLREFSSRTYHLLEASSDKIDDFHDNSILHIVKAFSDLLGIDCSVKSILSTLQNHIHSINDQIDDSSNLLLTSTFINKLSPDSTEFSICLKLFQNTKSNFGLLLLNDKNQVYEKTDETIFSNEINGGLIDFSSINIFLSNDNIMSSSDLLALHTAYKLVGKSTASINIFIKTGVNSSLTDKQSNEITELFNSRQEKINVTFILVKDDIDREIKTANPNIVNELFIAANNNPAADNSLKMFDTEINKLIDSSISQSFHVLVVKSPTII